ncbi:MAG: hypothetical protein AUH30_13345 [Candidatus Rokubacteria bacterium 13_1_40CM_68_15]|nr:MAG: hypothetical protein AUH30_13345 [Candidatus Rokubacteria bacterium 13_1_40CM_68_15]
MGHDLVPSAVHARSNAAPAQLALTDRERVISYEELDIRARRLARRLRELGAGRDVLVGVALDRSAEFVVAALGALYAGAAYVPLDCQYPAERIAFMLQDAAPAVVVSDARLAARLPRGAWPTLMIDVADGGDALAAEAVGADSTASSLAYVIYTSGSTGRPKGVEVTHGNLTNLVRWHHRAFGVTAEDRASQLSSPGFDAAVWEVWPYLASGASVHFADDQSRLDPGRLRDWLLERRITVGFVPTPVAERLLALEWPSEAPLRVLLTGADTLHRHPPAGLPFTLVNNYGPTEAAVVTTSGAIASADAGESRPTIGKPIDNVDVHIVDEHLRPVATGMVGELCVGGAGVARGYRNRPELTAARFVPDPFSARPGARLYRTGDRARRLPDGDIAFLGRVDGQLKVRGFRIEPDEIVAALDADPAVVASAVAVHDDGAGDRRLVAYVVPAPDMVPLPSMLRERLKTTLPEYMIPAVFVRLDTLPLTANGKVDRDALPAPDTADVLRDEPVTAPRTPVEQRLALIVASLLDTSAVGVNDNFFLLGGHSLLGTQLIARVRDAFGVDLPLRALFDHPTVEALAAEVERAILSRIEAAA